MRLESIPPHLGLNKVKNIKMPKLDYFNLRNRTEFVDSLFGLMLEYSIPVSAEDSGMLTAIKTQLGTLYSVMQSDRNS